VEISAGKVLVLCNFSDLSEGGEVMAINSAWYLVTKTPDLIAQTRGGISSELASFG
jgi:hypothetical protein